MTPPAKRVRLAGDKHFDWEKIGDLYLPVIYRGGRKFIPVRIAEMKLLSRFPNSIPHELKASQRCVSYYLSPEECHILSELNFTHCQCEYGQEPFSTNEVIVQCEQFQMFYEMVVDTVMSMDVLSSGLTEGGWLQINNTVCPYVWHDAVKHVPYEVVSLAAELLPSDPAPAKVTITAQHLQFLNKVCKQTNRMFEFDERTELLSMVYVKRACNPVIIELPPDAPFERAVYIDSTNTPEEVMHIKQASKTIMDTYYKSRILARQSNHVQHFAPSLPGDHVQLSVDPQSLVSNVTVRNPSHFGQSALTAPASPPSPLPATQIRAVSSDPAMFRGHNNQTPTAVRMPSLTRAPASADDASQSSFTGASSESSSISCSPSPRRSPASQNASIPYKLNSTVPARVPVCSSPIPYASQNSVHRQSSPPTYGQSVSIISAQSHPSVNDRHRAHGQSHLRPMGPHLPASPYTHLVTSYLSPVPSHGAECGHGMVAQHSPYVSTYPPVQGHHHQIQPYHPPMTCSPPMQQHPSYPPPYRSAPVSHAGMFHEQNFPSVDSHTRRLNERSGPVPQSTKLYDLHQGPTKQILVVDQKSNQSHTSKALLSAERRKHDARDYQSHLTAVQASMHHHSAGVGALDWCLQAPSTSNIQTKRSQDTATAHANFSAARPQQTANLQKETSTLLADRYVPSAYSRENPLAMHSLMSPIIHQIRTEQPFLNMILDAFPPDAMCSLTVIQLIVKCFVIYDKISIILRRAVESVDARTYKTELVKREAISVLGDAMSTFTFWNASAHKISVDAAEIINLALVNACLDDHPLSFRRSPDIIHFVIAGVFGARTLAAAANFRFLQEVMGVSMVARGMVEKIQPLVAYHQVHQRLEEYCVILINWCRIGQSELIEDLTHDRFAQIVYQLYDRVYGSCDMFMAHATSPPPTLLPLSVEAPAPKSAPLLQQSVQDLNQPQQTVRVKTESAVRQSCSQRTQSQVQSQSVQSQSSATTDDKAIPVKPKAPLFKQGSEENELGLHISSVTSLDDITVEMQAGASDDNPLMPAAPVKCSMILGPLNKTNPVCHVTPTPVEKSDLSDAVVLTRFHGKKVPSFRKGNDLWLLMEDVHKTYFPRKSWAQLFAFISEHHPVALKELTVDAQRAFKDFYDMVEHEQFEIDYMISTTDLTEVLNTAALLDTVANVKEPTPESQSNAPQRT